jgi:hypothetical protein
MARPATANLKCNPQIGQLPVLQYCSPDQLQIDESYQRSLDAAGSQTLIRRIAVHWDWGLCQPLFVARRADGGLYVVDGQHRLQAAKLRGDIWQLPCVVTSFATAADEAASFVALNQQRRPLNRLQIFKAALAAGDGEATIINEALAASEMWVGTSNDLNIQKPGAMTCIGALEGCLRSHGEAALISALSILRQAFEGQVLRYAGTMFPGIAGIVAAEIAADPKFALSDRFELMVEMVGGAQQSEWVAEINLIIAAQEATSRRQGAEKVFAKAWGECTAELLDEAA